MSEQQARAQLLQQYTTNLKVRFRAPATIDDRRQLLTLTLTFSGGSREPLASPLLHVVPFFPASRLSSERCALFNILTPLCLPFRFDVRANSVLSFLLSPRSRSLSDLTQRTSPRDTNAQGRIK